MIDVWGQAASGPIRIRLRPRANPQSPGNFLCDCASSLGTLTDPLALDLWSIACAVHLADRAVRRSPLLGKRIRQFELKIPVRQPRTWTQNAELIERLAGFASADEWRLTFVRGSYPRGTSDTTVKRPPKFDCVSLFSGGLDSLCGAALHAAANERVLFVTHSPPGRERARQLVSAVYSAFGRDSSRADSISFLLRPSELSARGTRSMFHEHSRRTRPFYFMALASAAALEWDVSRLVASENGPLAMSLPFRADAYGGTIARPAHAVMLRGFALLLNALHPRRGFTFQNQLSALTKGEAAAHLAGAGSLARGALSCEFIGKQAAVMRHWKQLHPRFAKRIGDGPQCGACLPCIVRRAALRHAEISDPSTDYFFDARSYASEESLFPGQEPPLYRNLATHPFHVHRFCARLVGMSLRDFTIQFLPELRALSAPGDRTAEPRPYFELARRFAKEVLFFFDH